MYVLLDEEGAVAQFPYSITDLRNDHPDTSFGMTLAAETLAEFRVFVVSPAEPPAASTIERISQADPVLIEGEWVQQWTVEPLAIEEARNLLRSRVNESRDARELTVAPTPFGVAQCDATSSKRLLAMQGAAMATLITGGDWDPIEWTMADNAKILLDTPAKGLVLAAAVTQFGAALHAHATSLKDAIDAAHDAGDFEAMAAIDIEAGWPA